MKTRLFFRSYSSNYFYVFQIFSLFKTRFVLDFEESGKHGAEVIADSASDIPDRKTHHRLQLRKRFHSSFASLRHSSLMCPYTLSRILCIGFFNQRHSGRQLWHPNSYTRDTDESLSICLYIWVCLSASPSFSLSFIRIKINMSTWLEC